MKKPLYFYGNGKSLTELHPLRREGDVAFVVLPLSEAAKDFLVGEAESALRLAIDNRVLNPRVLATAVLEAWLKAARGPNSRDQHLPLEVVPPPAGETKGIPSHRFASYLSDAIDWHRQNTNDPHNIDNAAIAILTEVREALLRALQ